MIAKVIVQVLVGTKCRTCEFCRKLMKPHIKNAAFGRSRLEENPLPDISSIRRNDLERSLESYHSEDEFAVDMAKRSRYSLFTIFR